MIVKKVNEQDYFRYMRLSTTSFHYRREFLADEVKAKEIVDKQIEDHKIEYGINRNKTVNLGVYEGDSLISAARIIPYTVSFDGNKVDMGGIQAVLTDPEFKKRGATRLLFPEALKIMKESGQYLSYLDQFSTDFYRKFGYELLNEEIKWEIPIEFLPEGNVCRIVHYEAEDAQKNDIKRVYAQFAQGFNMAVDRNDMLSWNSFFENVEAYKTDVYGYIHYNESGEPDGYLFYKRKWEEMKTTLEVVHNAFADVNGLKGLLSFLQSYHSHASHTAIGLPSSVDLSFFLKEMYLGGRHITREINTSGMARVIDAAEILKFARYEGCGEVSIGITDEYCSWNNNVFHVSFGSGATVVETADDRADIELDIKLFTALILGRLDFQQICYLPNVRINANEQNLKKVFYRKNIWLDDHF